MSTTTNDDFIADDVQAQALAENRLNPDSLVENDETPVTSGEMEIGNLDRDDELGSGGKESYDEEAVPGGEDNTIAEPIDEPVEE